MYQDNGMIRAISILSCSILLPLVSVMGQSSYVSVRTVPSGAVVLIDSVLYGTTPIDSILLPFGQHHMVVKKNEFHEKDFLFDVTEGANRNFFIHLIPTYGFYSVHVSPPGSLVSVDGSNPVTGPLIHRKTDAGKHTITVHHPDILHSITGSFTVGPGTLVTTEAPLDRFSLTAFEFSLFLPGLGQAMDGAVIKGVGEFLATAAAAYFIQYSQDRVEEKDRIYLAKKYLYDQAPYESIVPERRAAMIAAADDLDRSKKTRTVSYAVLGAVYLASLADALVFHSHTTTLSIHSSVILPFQDGYHQLPSTEIRLEVPIR